MSEDEGPFNEISVYIEGLLVQTRDTTTIYHWAKETMPAVYNSMCQEFGDSFNAWRLNLVKSNEPWAYHFKELDGYILVKPQIGSKLFYSDIAISFNKTNADAPNLDITCKHANHSLWPSLLAAVASLGQYYLADETILGDGNEEETSGALHNKGDD